MSEPVNTFGQYGRDFQEKILQALLVDKRWAEQMMEVLKVEYFELKYLQYLVMKYFSYAKKYKEFPTLQLLVTILKDELKTGTDLILRDQIIDYLQKIKTNPNVCDLPFIKEKSLDFCRKQALKEALEKSIELVSTEEYEKVVEVIKKAVSVGTTPSVGHDFLNDIDARFVRLKRDCIPTGLTELDAKEVFNGGVGRGELAVVVGGTGTGKSHFLVQMGCNAMKAGKNVLHYTFELSEALVGMRYDSNLCDIQFNDLYESKDSIPEIYKNKNLGSLFIKEYPMNTCTIYTIRNHIEKLSLKGFQPDLVIIDYADIMRSSRQYDSLRHELKLIYEELRSYASEIQVPIWTACFHGDTLIKTTTGNFKISELVGKNNFPVYAYNHSSKKVEMRMVKSVYSSGKNVQVMKVTLDNGKSVIATPNHKFMRRDGSYCELQDLIIGESLMPFYSEIENETGLERVSRNDGTWEYTHKMISELKYGVYSKYFDIKFVDGDNKNNNIDNIELDTKTPQRKNYIFTYGSTQEERIEKHFENAMKSNSYSEYMHRTSHIPLRKQIKLKVWREKNHKIVSIEQAGYADVYNMEVDDLHNYALDAGIIVKNSQANRDSSQNDVVDVNSMSEAHGKAMTADIVVTISRKTAEKSSGHGRLFIAKSRAGKDGIVFPLHIDTSKSLFTITGNQTTPNEVQNESENYNKKTIREKLKELTEDNRLKLESFSNKKISNE